MALCRYITCFGGLSKLNFFASSSEFYQRQLSIFCLIISVAFCIPKTRGIQILKMFSAAFQVHYCIVHDLLWRPQEFRFSLRAVNFIKSSCVHISQLLMSEFFAYVRFLVCSMLFPRLSPNLVMLHMQHSPFTAFRVNDIVWFFFAAGGKWYICS